RVDLAERDLAEVAEDVLPEGRVRGRVDAADGVLDLVLDDRRGELEAGDGVDGDDRHVEDAGCGGEGAGVDVAPVSDLRAGGGRADVDVVAVDRELDGLVVDLLVEVAGAAGGGDPVVGVRGGGDVLVRWQDHRLGGDDLVAGRDEVAGRVQRRRHGRY